MSDIQTPIPTNYGYFNEKFTSIWEQLMESVQAEFADGIEKIERHHTFSWRACDDLFFS